MPAHFCVVAQCVNMPGRSSEACPGYVLADAKKTIMRDFLRDYARTFDRSSKACGVNQCDAGSALARIERRGTRLKRRGGRRSQYARKRAARSGGRCANSPRMIRQAVASIRRPTPRTRVAVYCSSLGDLSLICDQF